MNDNGWIKYYCECFVGFSLGFGVISFGILLLSVSYNILTQAH